MKDEKTYSEKLKDPRWQKKRLEIMQRDEFMCKCCYTKDETLNVHHSYYINGKEIWEYPDDSLLTVCESCHKEIHKLKDIIKKTIDEKFTEKDTLEFLLLVLQRISGIRYPPDHDAVYMCLDIISGKQSFSDAMFLAFGQALKFRQSDYPF